MGLGLFGSLVRHSVGIACELLTLRDPFDEHVYVPPEVTGSHVDECGRTVLEVRAENYRDVTALTDGITPAGNVSEVHTHVGHNQWEISVEDWDIYCPEVE